VFALLFVSFVQYLTCGYFFNTVVDLKIAYGRLMKTGRKKCRVGYPSETWFVAFMPGPETPLSGDS
jgi:hypothetical protein